MYIYVWQSQSEDEYKEIVFNEKYSWQQILAKTDEWNNVLYVA